MALDITIVDNSGLPREVLAVPLEIYGTIFLLVKFEDEKYPFFSRMKNYYEDADYNFYELPFLLDEIGKFKILFSEEKPEHYRETIEFLNKFESLCIEAMNKNFSISAIAD